MQHREGLFAYTRQAYSSSSSKEQQGRAAAGQLRVGGGGAAAQARPAQGSPAAPQNRRQPAPAHAAQYSSASAGASAHAMKDGPGGQPVFKYAKLGPPAEHPINHQHSRLQAGQQTEAGPLGVEPSFAQAPLHWVRWRLWLAFMRLEWAIAANMLDPWERVMLHSLLAIFLAFCAKGLWRAGCVGYASAVASAPGVLAAARQALDAARALIAGAAGLQVPLGKLLGA